MLVRVYPRSRSAAETRSARAELGKAPGKFFRRADSKAFAAGKALAGEIMPVMGDRDARIAERGAMIRVSRVAASTTMESSPDVPAAKVIDAARFV